MQILRQGANWKLTQRDSGTVLVRQFDCNHLSIQNVAATHQSGSMHTPCMSRIGFTGDKPEKVFLHIVSTNAQMLGMLSHLVARTVKILRHLGSQM